MLLIEFQDKLLHQLVLSNFHIDLVKIETIVLALNLPTAK